MLNVARYSYLHTLVTIFSQQLISTPQFLKILKLPIEEIVIALENRGLDNIIKNLSQSQFKLPPAGNMDNLFLSALLKDAQSLIRSLTGIERDFFIYWVRRFELQNIKTILRGKSLQCSSDQIRGELTQLGNFSTLPVEELLSTDDIPEILNLLKNTPFSAIARYSSDNFEQKQDVFSVETSINHQYFNGLEKRLRMLNKQEQNTIHPILGRIIDQINLIWILRYRLNYQLSASHTYFLLASGGFHLNSNDLIRLSQIEKFEQVFAMLPQKLAVLIDHADSIHTIELCLEKKIIELAQSLLRNTQFSLTQAFLYLVIREKQLFQIHALLKGKLLQLADKDIQFAMGNSK